MASWAGWQSLYMCTNCISTQYTCGYCITQTSSPWPHIFSVIVSLKVVAKTGSKQSTRPQAALSEHRGFHSVAKKRDFSFFSGRKDCPQLDLSGVLMASSSEWNLAQTGTCENSMSLLWNLRQPVAAGLSVCGFTWAVLYEVSNL